MCVECGVRVNTIRIRSNANPKAPAKNSLLLSPPLELMVINYRCELPLIRKREKSELTITFFGSLSPYQFYCKTPLKSSVIATRIIPPLTVVLKDGQLWCFVVDRSAAAAELHERILVDHQREVTPREELVERLIAVLEIVEEARLQYVARQSALRRRRRPPPQSTRGGTLRSVQLDGRYKTI